MPISRWIALWGLAALVAVGNAATVNVTPTDFAAKVATAAAGDVITLAAGDYKAPLTGFRDRQQVVAAGPATVNAAGTLGIDLGATTGVLLRGINVSGAKLGVSADKSHTARLEFCTFSACQRGIDAGDGLLVSACSLLDCAGDGVVVGTTAPNVQVVGCRLSGAKNATVGLSVAGASVSLRDNLVVGFATGVKLDKAADALIEGNTLQSTLSVGTNHVVGIEVRGGPQTTLWANTIRDSDPCVVVSGARGVRLVANWLVDSRVTGWTPPPEPVKAEVTNAKKGKKDKRAKPEPPAPTIVYGPGIGVLIDNQSAASDGLMVSNLFQVAGPAARLQVARGVGLPKRATTWPGLSAWQWQDNHYDRLAEDADAAPFEVVQGADAKARPISVTDLKDYDAHGELATASVGALGLGVGWRQLSGVWCPGLVDSSLDIGAADRGRALTWQGDPEHCQLPTDDNTHSGKASLSVSCGQAGEGFVGWHNAPLWVTPGQRLNAAIWLTLEGVQPAQDTRGGVSARLVFRSATGVEVGATPLVDATHWPLLHRGSQPWTDVNVDATVPAGAACAQLELGLAQAAGAVRFDDLSLAITEPAAPRELHRTWQHRPVPEDKKPAMDKFKTPRPPWMDPW